MQITVEVTNEQITQALDRQVRVALGHYFQSREINQIVTDHVKQMLPLLLEESIKEISHEELKTLFLERLKVAVENKVKTRLKGL